MITINVKCEGVAPLLMNPATNDVLESLRTGARKPKVKDLTREVEASEKLYKSNGQIGLPSLNLFSCLVEAGRMVDFEARRKVSTTEGSLLPALLSIHEMFLPFPKGALWVPDVRRGVNPRGGEMVCIVRPRFDEWSFPVTVDVDEKRFVAEKARQLFDQAGSFVGLGDFRPARRGPFGRFKVVHWEVLNGKQ